MVRVGLMAFLVLYLLLVGFTSGQKCPEPEHCTCTVNAVRCVGLEASGTLTDVVKGLATELPSTEELVFENAAIVTIEADKFKGLPGLKKLHFKNAGFYGAGISSLAFNGLSQVTELSITDNQNSPTIALPSKVFQPLSSLRKLDLSGNNLPGATIKENLLLGLTGLETLDLSFNNLGTISGNQFTGLTSLKSLSLSSSKVLVLTLTTFSGMTKLESLDLSSNPGISLSVDALSPFSSLNSINLNSNQLDTFSDEVLAPVKGTLEHLDLSQNNIEILKNNAFASLSNLKVLNLSAMVNPMHEIGPEAFSGLQNLVTLDLRKNKMSHIRPDPFRSISQAEIKLEDNRFFCNCEVADMQRWMLDQQANTDVVCMMPFRLMHKSLKTLDLVDDIGCKTPKLIAKERIRSEMGVDSTFECGMMDYHTFPKVAYRIVSGSPLPSNRTTIRVVNTTSSRNEYTFKYVFTVTEVSDSDSGQIECSGNGGFGNDKVTIDIYYGQEGLPLWTIIVIIACVVVVFAVIIITVVVVKKNKKRKNKSDKYASVPRHSYVA